MRFIPTRVHGYLDYGLGVLLIAAPWLLGFNDAGAATWVPVVLGVGIIIYSLFTAYELGAIPAIKMPVHLGLDAAGGILLAASPWIFQFADEVWIPHLVLGLVEIATAATTSTTPARLPLHGRGTASRQTP